MFEILLEYKTKTTILNIKLPLFNQTAECMEIVANILEIMFHVNIKFRF